MHDTRQEEGEVVSSSTLSHQAEIKFEAQPLLLWNHTVALWSVHAASGLNDCEKVRMV